MAKTKLPSRSEKSAAETETAKKQPLHQRSKNPAHPNPAKPLPSPGKGEARAIATADARLEARDVPFQVKVDHTKQAMQIGPPHSDLEGFTSRHLDAFGTRSRAFAEMEMRRLLKALGSSNSKLADQMTINAALAAVDGIKPQNEVEAMLASQMAMTHVLAMQAMSRAHWAEMIPEYQAAGNFANSRCL